MKDIIIILINFNAYNIKYVIMTPHKILHRRYKYLIY